VRPVQAGECLHRFDAAERLVHIHRVQQRLVVASLELVGANQKAVRVFLNLVGDLTAGKAVQLPSLTFSPLYSGSPEKATMGAIRAFDFREVSRERDEVLDRPLDAAGHHHRPRLAADLVLADHLFEEVIDHDLRLVADGLAVALDIDAQFLARLLDVVLGIASTVLASR
jgi:hypothetical protein